MYDELVVYKQRFGDCNVPAKWKENRSLGMWVSGQRELKKRGRLSDERIRQLDALKFDWQPYATSWDEMFCRLLKYKQQHVDCNVPAHWKKDRILARWVGKQRRKKYEGQLSISRIRRLNELKFEWGKDFRADRWEEMYGRLCVYKRTHNNCNVPARWKQDYSLGRWVAVQRAFKSRGMVSSERIRKLDSLGFNWDPISIQWETMFKRLGAYKKKYGDCNVPHLWMEDRELGYWVAKQRQLKAIGRLSPERENQLALLGLKWSLRQPRQMLNRPAIQRSSIAIREIAGDKT